MNIATALNRKYLEYTVVMLCSLCENNNEHIDAYLLHSELTTQDIDIIKNSLSKYDITIISVEIIYVFLTIFLYLLKCPQSLIL